jgi:multidrug efflux pump subunit AcrA (membrane-fusion protein)
MPLRQPKVRSDLEYFEQEIEGEEVVVVRDPVRGTYYKYNPLQAAMLKSLDGVRTLDQMVETLSETFEVEIPRTAAERFVASARERMLLDVASLNVSDKRAQKFVLAELDKEGFRFRGIGENTGTDLHTRIASPEAVLFMGGIRQLQAGEPARALDYFTAVLELNPENKRAKRLFDVIQSAYVKALSGATTDFPTMWRFDPTRLLTFLDRTIGRVLFHPLGWLVVLLYVATAVYCASVTTLPELDLGPFDIALFYFFLVVQALMHEGGHGLACHHAGGRVQEIGFSRYYYIAPFPYCDTSSSYLFKRRKDKLLVHAAGTIGDVLFASTAMILLTLFRSDVFFAQALQLNLYFTLFGMFTNVVPFLKLDAYYALCDILGITNLRERSFALLKARLGNLLFGLGTREEQLERGKRRLFLVFGAAAILFTMFWLYQLLFRLVAAAIERFGGMGLILAVLVLGYLLRRVLVRPFKQLGGLLIRERRKVFTVRRTAVLALLLAVIVAPWFLITWPVLVDAEFVLVPKERREARAAVAGIVQEVLVKEGDSVTVGQPLAQLQNVELRHELQVVETDIIQFDIQLAQLRSGARDEEIALARSQVTAAAAAGQRDAMEARRQATLANAGAGTRTLEASGTAAVSLSKASAARWKLATLQAGTREETIVAAEAVRAQLVAQRDRAGAELKLLTIRSPIAGVVASKHLSDRIGERLERGETFAEVHDVSAFIAELTVPATAPLSEIAVSDEIELRVHGLPDVVLASRVQHTRVEDTDERRSAMTVIGTPFAMPGGRSGLAGHARIYGRHRSLAYAKFYLPAERVVRVSLWALL